MQYEIITSKKTSTNSGKMLVYIDHVPLLAVPRAISISIGNKESMYKKYLENRVFNPNDKQQFLNFIVQLHDKAIEMGGMELVCDCKYSSFHAKVLKEFIETNSEMFNNLISYLVPGTKNKIAMFDNTQKPELPEGFTIPDDMTDGTKAVEGEFIPMNDPNVNIPSMPGMQMGRQTTLGELNVPGADQLRALIMADMEKEKMALEICEMQSKEIVDAEIIVTKDELEPHH